MKKILVSILVIGIGITFLSANKVTAVPVYYTFEGTISSGINVGDVASYILLIDMGRDDLVTYANGATHSYDDKFYQSDSGKWYYDQDFRYADYISGSPIHYLSSSDPGTVAEHNYVNSYFKETNGYYNNDPVNGSFRAVQGSTSIAVGSSNHQISIGKSYYFFEGALNPARGSIEPISSWNTSTDGLRLIDTAYDSSGNAYQITINDLRITRISSTIPDGLILPEPTDPFANHLPVPIPNTMVLLGMGLLSFSCIRREKPEK